jgi:hypothetical protein
MEKVVGPRMRRNSSLLELVVQQSVSSKRMRPTTHGSTNRHGNPATNSRITALKGHVLKPKSVTRSQCDRSFNIVSEFDYLGYELK